MPLIVKRNYTVIFNHDSIVAKDYVAIDPLSIAARYFYPHLIIWGNQYFLTFRLLV